MQAIARLIGLVARSLEVCTGFIFERMRNTKLTPRYRQFRYQWAVYDPSG